MRKSIAAIALCLASGAMAQTSPYFENKAITVIVGNDAGSGYDAYARLLTRHMGKHIPGNPNFVVRNMPGAGSIVAAQHVFNVAPKDGTLIATLFPGALVEPLTGDPAKYRYDPTKFEYIGTADSGTRLCFTMASPVAWEHHYGVLAPALAWLAPIAAGSVRRVSAGAWLAGAYLAVASLLHPLDVFAATRVNVLQNNLFAGALLLLFVLLRAGRRA